VKIDPQDKPCILTSTHVTVCLCSHSWLWTLGKVWGAAPWDEGWQLWICFFFASWVFLCLRQHRTRGIVVLDKTKPSEYVILEIEVFTARHFSENLKEEWKQVPWSWAGVRGGGHSKPL
jgi:hypothetical protein